MRFILTITVPENFDMEDDLYNLLVGGGLMDDLASDIQKVVAEFSMDQLGQDYGRNAYRLVRAKLEEREGT